MLRPLAAALAIVPFLLVPALVQDVDRLIDDLGSHDFEAREAAQDRLASAGRLAVPALRRAARSVDPEVRLRAALALEEVEWPALRALRRASRSAIEVTLPVAYAPDWRVYLVSGAPSRAVIVRRRDPSIVALDEGNLRRLLAAWLPRNLVESELVYSILIELGRNAKLYGVYPGHC